MANVDIAYEQLPSEVRDSLTPRQWEDARRRGIPEGEPVPATATFMNLMNGQRREYTRGEPAPGPLFPAHDLAGAEAGTRTRTEPATDPRSRTWGE